MTRLIERCMLIAAYFHDTTAAVIRYFSIDIYRISRGCRHVEGRYFARSYLLYEMIERADARSARRVRGRRVRATRRRSA